VSRSFDHLPRLSNLLGALGHGLSSHHLKEVDLLHVACGGTLVTVRRVQRTELHAERGSSIGLRGAVRYQTRRHPLASADPDTTK
jgi:hypothetical protein